MLSRFFACQNEGHSSTTRRATLWFLICAAAGLGQTARPGFEVASVHRASTSPQGGIRFSGNQFNASSVTLRMLIENAYQLKPFQLTGGPGWMDSDRFTIQASAADESLTAENGRLMLQSLLEERFGLVTHRETKEQTVYRLLVRDPAKVAEHFKPPADPGRSTIQIATTGNRNVHYEFNSVTMARFADMLSRELERVVEDHTGFAGPFDLVIDAEREETEINPFRAPLAPLLTEIGLRAESTKGPVEIFVVDRLTEPTEN